ncbi:MBL fold metallo-hydrolase [Nocardioides sp. Kera G14]|uniref:MBL fold metallo-hydrolase n=1 Tax=Nocardioides sp. Kera G14 TaxID=2884264 RepID=UPI001D111679|nr:MBL fold metallo-hydrolase [Nocardioides sp. Kera G14]UDY23898.1 MBL fold metallo-hydrolase [Nocardioides sp. Kera G14]
MRITKFGHACVRVETESGTLLFDPGMFVTPEVFDGVDAVLITHEHPDHYLPDLLTSTDAPVFTIDAVAAKINDEAPEVRERTTIVTPGQGFEAAGVQVTAVGELHAVIHPEMPRFFNSGYLVDADGTSVFHPGDALTAPEGVTPGVLLAPSSAPWARSSELIDFVRSVGAARNLAIHDRIYSDVGAAIFDQQMNGLIGEGQAWSRLADGADL